MNIKTLKQYFLICAALQLEPTFEGLKRVAPVLEEKIKSKSDVLRIEIN